MFWKNKTMYKLKKKNLEFVYNIKCRPYSDLQVSFTIAPPPRHISISKPLNTVKAQIISDFVHFSMFKNVLLYSL
jgi:hypothetical protein